MGRIADDDNRPLPGKLKNPFNRQGKGDDRTRKIPGKLNDDRFDDMGKRPDGDNRPLPGKLKNPFDGQGKGDDKERKIPGKLKNKFGEPKPEKDKNNNKVKKTGRKEAPNLGKKGKNTPEEDVQNNNKLLTYLSLITEPEAFKDVYADANPEGGLFYE